ncbi:Mu-like prophage major head subunit gpT family protein [Oceanobacter sp. 4_MG-2023]|uniref:Mu-like prophage major head subunit gpT family protein n=1 Tax=Oceanobacter sp. 4_MG-2023 TaxID=3062623 RepID=UPI0027337D01|nr:Mu-like prophage major head subunit gpT family protein [Oceanobacter sp. 4_MG-2023]MDP2548081.1 Mu-like prophage major head subunit gpT family protein [Oceanobacter sp. 4_MG-2023]
MAMITTTLLNSLRTAFRSDFQNALQTVDPQYTQVATLVPSTTKSNTYGWLGAMPGFREWVGDRVMNSITEHGYSITNKTFESSIAVNRDDIEDDNLGIYKPMVQELAREGMEFPDELVFALLTNGWAATCYDGQYFFDTDHPVNDSHDGTGTDASVSNVQVNGSYTGEPWYLLDTSRAIKPLIWQNRRNLNLTTLFNPDDPAVFTSNEFQFGADLRGNAGFGFWQMAYGVKDDLNAANLWAAWSAMRGFTRDGGKKLKIKPTLLVVPASLEEAATKLLERDLLVENGAAVNNELKGKVKLLVADAL